MRLQGPGLVSSLFSFLMIASVAQARVSDEMEAYYTQKYLNKAMFLKVPVRGDRQTIHVLEEGSSLDQSNLGEPLRFKVGEQVRIIDLNFRDSSIEFEVSSIDTARTGRVIFQFRDPLRHSFPNRASFDAALENSFTEGLSYQEIDSAKENFVQDQFDALLQQFAVTTGTSVEFVLEAITERNPKYRQSRQELEEARSRIQELQVELQSEKDRSETFRNQSEKAVGSLAELNQTNRALRDERDKVEGQRAELERAVRKLEDENARFREQVENVARKLDVQTDSNSKLGQQVQSLSEVIDSLKEERTTLSGRVEGLNQKLTDITKKNAQLVNDLERSERQNQKLKSDLSALTSNRDSLEATYLSLKRNKENLERAEALEAAIRVERTLETREDATYQVSSLYLLSQKIGVLEVQEPRYPNEEYRISFRVESPNTVEFTAEERELYESLGDKFKVGTHWDSGSGRLEPVLRSGQAVQEVAVRDRGEWTWLFQGALNEPETLTLTLQLIDQDEQVLKVAAQEFQVLPSGVLAHFSHSFSLFSVLFGLILGVVLCLLGGAIRGRTQSTRNGARRRAEIAAQKKL